MVLGPVALEPAQAAANVSVAKPVEVLARALPAPLAPVPPTLQSESSYVHPPGERSEQARSATVCS